MVKYINFRVDLTYFSELLAFLAQLSNTHQVSHSPLSWFPISRHFYIPASHWEKTGWMVISDKAQNEGVKRVV